jgi:hypothetical protein
VTRIALALRTGGKVPDRFYRWYLVRKLGWTLAEVDALTMGDMREGQLYLKGEKQYKQSTIR